MYTNISKVCTTDVLTRGQWI